MKKIEGIPASQGIAIGPAFIYQPAVPPVEQRTITDPAAELARLDQAIAEADKALLAIKTNVEQTVGHTEAQIFEVQRMFLKDPVFVGVIKQTVETEKINVEQALEQTVAGLVKQFKGLEDEYFQQRATDIQDVGQRLLRLLAGWGEGSLADLAEPAIILAENLTPSDTASLNRNMALAFCTSAGSTTAHTAILARSLRIPAVVGLGQDLWQTTTSNQLIVNGDTGEVWLDPDAGTIAVYQNRRQAEKQAQAQLQVGTKEPAITTDGHRVEVAANIGSVEEARPALDMGAEGVGLLRTEFLFLRQKTLPTEAEQYQVYRSIAEVLQPFPLIVRTLDVGGDKPLPALTMPAEQNPFLGQRAIRLSLAEPELFQTQLRAILRAGYNYNLKIMFPMISSVKELRQALDQLDEARASLEAQKIPYNKSCEIGIMVEVPSAAVMAEAIAPLVDFFSIGTNDLTQYTLAADRTNPLVAPLANPLDPAVLRLVKQVVEAAHHHHKWVGMCGELAGNSLATPLLLGLGLDELSMTGSAIPAVKSIIRHLNLAEAKQVADKALTLESAEAIEDYLRQRIPKLDH